MNRAHDLRMLLAGVPELRVTGTTSDAQAEAAMRTIDVLNGSMLGLVRFSGSTPWERHRDGDELLHVLDGDVEVTVLGEDETVTATLRAGSVLIVPRGLWHRQRALPVVALLFSTPAERTGTSWADDPRRDA